MKLGLVPPRCFDDDRGHLKVLIESCGVTLKRSFSRVGVFRGLHIQGPPNQQTKFVRVLEGAILDVCLDLNGLSDDHGKFMFFELRPSSDFFCIPPWYAHGFLALEETLFEYVCIGEYNESTEAVVKMPLELLSKWSPEFSKIILSDKDRAGMAIEDAIKKFTGIGWGECY